MATTTIQILQSLEQEMEKLVSELEQQVSIKLKSLSPKSSIAEPEELTPQPQQKFGVGAPWQGYFPIQQQQQATSAPPAKKRWKGLRGLWNWLMHGDADRHSATKPNHSEKYPFWPKESINGRPTLSEYLEVQRQLESIADKLLSEVVSDIAEVSVNELESHPEFASLFASFRLKIRDTFNKYRKQLNTATVADFPNDPDPNVAKSRSSIDDDERTKLTDPNISTVDDTPDDEIAAAYAAQDAQKVNKKDKNSRAFEEAAAMVKKGDIPEPDASWFTSKNSIVWNKLPHAIAWLISKGYVDDANDGSRRPVNILDPTDVREALKGLGYTGTGNLVARLAGRLGISLKDKDAIAQHVLAPLGWKYGATMKPKPVGVGDVSPSKPEKSDKPKSWKNLTMSDFIDDVTDQPKDDDEEVPDEELMKLHRTLGYKDDDEPDVTPDEPKVIPDDLDEPAPKKPEVVPDKPTSAKKTDEPEDIDSTDINSLDDKMASIVQKIDDPNRRDSIASGWNKIRKRIKGDEGKGDYGIEDLLDYIKAAEELTKPKIPSWLGKFESKLESGKPILANESVLASIRAKKLDCAKLKDFYLSLLRS